MKKNAPIRMGQRSLAIVLFAVAALLLSSAVALAQLTIDDVQTTDVTPSGFAVVWRTSEAAAPQIAVFEDPGQTVDLTSQLEVTLFPLSGGNPAMTDAFDREEAMDVLRDTAKSLGLMKIGVHGCLPQTTYYFRITSDNGSEQVQWPSSGPASVTTTKENAFVQESRQVLATLTDTEGTTDFQGWLVTAATDEAIYPISSYVGDGAGINQANLDLSNLFDGQEDNWTPAGLKVVTLEVRIPGAAPIQRGMTLVYSDGFRVSSVSTVQINVDEAGDKTPPNVTPSPPGGTYMNAQEVALTADEEAFIFFTTDGSNPTTDSNVYTDPINIDQTTTLTFMAIDMAGNQSATTSAAYTIVYNAAPYEPLSPVPVDGAAVVSIDTELTWQCDGDPDAGDTVSYDVYLWTDQKTEPPVCADLAGLTCQPGMLQFDTLYFWQVIAKDDRTGRTEGDVWGFRTFTHDGDEDSDGLNNADEVSWMTDPYAWDTDEDGYSDYDEIGVGTDPLDKLSRPPYPPGYGDIDGDRDIDGEDLALLVAALDSVTGDSRYLPEADFNGDGAIDGVDLELFARVFGLAFQGGYDPLADFDSDGDVDGDDFSALVAAFGTVEGDLGYDFRFDLNQDGTVNRWDIALFSTAFGSVDE